MPLLLFLLEADGDMAGFGGVTVARELENHDDS